MLFTGDSKSREERGEREKFVFCSFCFNKIVFNERIGGGSEFLSSSWPAVGEFGFKPRPTIFRFSVRTRPNGKLIIGRPG